MGVRLKGLMAWRVTLSGGNRSYPRRRTPLASANWFTAEYPQRVAPHRSSLRLVRVMGRLAAMTPAMGAVMHSAAVKTQAEVKMSWWKG